MVDTIYTLSDSIIIYSNDNGAYIQFDLCKEAKGGDNRILESVRVGNGTIARNKINITDPFSITLIMNEITEEDRDALSQAFEDEDDSGIVTITQTQKNSSIVTTTTWVNAIPTKNERNNMQLAESIVTKRVEIMFATDEPKVTYG